MEHLGGDLVMSKKEGDWLKVLERVKKKEITLRQASHIMDGSYRQCRSWRSAGT
jgi:hypothetical protein